MALTSPIIYPMSLLLCLVMVAGALAAPPESQQEGKDQFMPTTADMVLTDVDSTPYTEAIPSHDFTYSNVSSTIEEILADVGVLQYTETR